MAIYLSVFMLSRCKLECLKTFEPMTLNTHDTRSPRCCAIWIINQFAEQVLPYIAIEEVVS